MKAEPEIRTDILLFHLGGDSMELEWKNGETEKKKRKIVKEGILSLSSLWATEAQSHLGTSDKNYCMYTKFLYEVFEAGVCIYQPWISTVYRRHISPRISTFTSSLMTQLQMGCESLSLLLRERSMKELCISVKSPLQLQ